jgi:hypothetical protein
VSCGAREESGLEPTRRLKSISGDSLGGAACDDAPARLGPVARRAQLHVTAEQPLPLVQEL